MQPLHRLSDRNAIVSISALRAFSQNPEPEQFARCDPSVHARVTNQFEAFV